ncbi:MAG: WbqC family protein, partial [Cyanobacteriota bacterium]
PNYIPWKGYFEIIDLVDEFILLDDTQYTRRDWRNRNKIKTQNGLKWLTIPIENKGNYYKNINEIKIAHKNWNKDHWKTILHNYSKAKYWKTYKDLFEELYLTCNYIHLNTINYKFITAINKILNITTKVTLASSFNFKGNKSEKLLYICKKTNAKEYLSGPKAKNYLDINLFKQEKIAIKWKEYINYPEYSQLYLPFEHNVSIIDLILNEGPDSKKFIYSTD